MLVEHRQGLQTVFLQLLPGVVDEGLGAGGLHVAGHDPCRGQLAHAPAQGVALCMVDQSLEIVAGDVDVFAEVLQRLVQVPGGEVRTRARRQVAGAMKIGPRRLVGARVGRAHQVVVEQRAADQHQGGEQDRPDHVDAEFAQGRVEGHAQGQRAARRMQAAQGEHQQHAEGHADQGRGQIVSEPIGAEAAGQGGDQVAAEHRPGLRQGAGGEGEQ